MTKTKAFDLAKIVKVFLPAIGLLGSVVGLIVNLPKVVSNPTQRLVFAILLGVIAVVSLVFLFVAIYERVLKRLKILETQMRLISSTASKFIAANQGGPISEAIDLNLINLLLTTRSLRDVHPAVSDLKVVNSQRIEVVIDKGFADGFVTGMLFKVFHKQQLVELGVCQCTPNHNEAQLVIDASPACPISFGHLSKDVIEVHLIEPTNHSPMNTLLADILFATDVALRRD
jgi:cell shape-determining protein MreC